MKFDKLVRDNIPNIIKEKYNKKPIFYAVDGGEYRKRLDDKLQEEVSEFLQDDNVEELADILEVIYAICDYKKITKQDLENCRLKKAQERGAFKDKIILDRVE